VSGQRVAMVGGVVLGRKWYRGASGDDGRIAIVRSNGYGYAGESYMVDWRIEGVHVLAGMWHQDVDGRCGNQRRPNTPNTTSFYITSPRHNPALPHNCYRYMRLANQ
jgi:hypothetical protein